MIAAGQSIGNYRILNKIGTGGMGAVFLAEHPLIGKRVALKVIHRELATNRDVVSRFFQEARAVNRIGNEHIVEVHDFGITPEGDHFFIMEYLEGRTLASILSREKALDVMRALHVGAQIANALAAAHAAGIIHRDLKPDNIMLLARLGDPDFVKVLDFGLAKVFSAATAVKTAAGVLLGTPQYMSPEACESRGDVDHRTDIYALGILLFQMLTGVLPFDGDSMGEVLVKQVTALPPAPRALNPSLPPSVEQILLRCLAKRADARFATMMQLRDALLDPEGYLRGSPPIAPARSVGPGENLGNAKTLIAAAAPVTRAPLPLAAPPPSLTGQGPTMMAPGGWSPPKYATQGMPALAPPQEPKMNTMRIATPMGYSSRPPRKVWPIVLLLALIAGGGGGALAVALGGKSVATPPARDASVDAHVALDARAVDSPAPPSGSAASLGGAEVVDAAVDAALDASAAVDAAVEVVDAAAPDAAIPDAAPAVRTARLSIDSVPAGATVTGPDGAVLGKTPLKVEWPRSDQPVTFELRLGGYKRKQRETVVNSNTALHFELERVAVVRHPSSSTTKPRPAEKDERSENGLMRP